MWNKISKRRSLKSHNIAIKTIIVTPDSNKKNITKSFKGKVALCKNLQLLTSISIYHQNIIRYSHKEIRAKEIYIYFKIMQHRHYRYGWCKCRTAGWNSVCVQKLLGLTNSLKVFRYFPQSYRTHIPRCTAPFTDRPLNVYIRMFPHAAFPTKI
jgi:hypothetical protein